MGEHLDVYDDLGRHLGAHPRDVVHARGLWHRTFHLLVVADRPGGPAAILQRRATAKRVFPGLVDLTATGHLEAGEAAHEGVRELREEMGIDLDAGALLHLGVRRMIDETPEGTNREFCHVFLAHDDRPLDAYAPGPDEVAAVLEIAVADALDLVSGVRHRAPARSFAAAPSSGGRSAETWIELAAEELVPEPPLVDVDPSGRRAYWIALLGAAAAFAAGETRLAI